MPTFVCPNGKSLAYRRNIPEIIDQQSAEILYLNGYNATIDAIKPCFVQQFSSSNGWISTAFDYFGHGSSSGDIKEGTISIWLDDVLQIVDNVTQGPLILVGASLGAWLMVLAALKRLNRIRAMIGVGSAPDFTEALIWNNLPDPYRSALMNQGFVDFGEKFASDGFLFTRCLIEDGRKHLILRDSIPIEVPVRLLHGTQDAFVPYSYSQMLIQNLHSRDAKLELIEGGDHSLSSSSDLNRLADAMLEMQNLKS